MKSQQEPGDAGRLDKALGEWVVNNPLPPGFQDQVWKRIARSEASRAGWWDTLAGLLETALPRPRYAVACLALFLALGLGAGAVAAQIKTHRLDSELRTRYVQSLDPYRMGESQP